VNIVRAVKLLPCLLFLTFIYWVALCLVILADNVLTKPHEFLRIPCRSRIAMDGFSLQVIKDYHRCCTNSILISKFFFNHFIASEIYYLGIAILIGVLRILRGWPIHYLIIGGYCCVMAITPFAPKEIIGIAYDAGGVTTSTVTVPLVTALGVGLATIIKGRNPLVDGFGLIAFASLFPMMFVMGYGMIIFR